VIIDTPLREEIFAEFNFADFGPIRGIIREIWFFSFSEKRGQNGREGQNWAKSLIRENFCL